MCQDFRVALFLIRRALRDTVRGRGFQHPPALDMGQIRARLSTLVPTVVSLSLADPVQAAGRGLETGASSAVVFPSSHVAQRPHVLRAVLHGSRTFTLHAAAAVSSRENKGGGAPTTGSFSAEPRRVVQSRSQAADYVDTLQRTFLCPSRGSRARGDV